MPEGKFFGVDLEKSFQEINDGKIYKNPNSREVDHSKYPWKTKEEAIKIFKIDSEKRADLEKKIENPSSIDDRMSNYYRKEGHEKAVFKMITGKQLSETDSLQMQIMITEDLFDWNKPEFSEIGKLYKEMSNLETKLFGENGASRTDQSLIAMELLSAYGNATAYDNLKENLEQRKEYYEELEKTSKIKNVPVSELHQTIDRAHAGTNTSGINLNRNSSTIERAQDRQLSDRAYEDDENLGVKKIYSRTLVYDDMLRLDTDHIYTAKKALDDYKLQENKDVMILDGKSIKIESDTEAKKGGTYFNSPLGIPNDDGKQYLPEPVYVGKLDINPFTNEILPFDEELHKEMEERKAFTISPTIETKEIGIENIIIPEPEPLPEPEPEPEPLPEQLTKPEPKPLPETEKTKDKEEKEDKVDNYKLMKEKIKELYKDDNKLDREDIDELLALSKVMKDVKTVIASSGGIAIRVEIDEIGGKERDKEYKFQEKGENKGKRKGFDLGDAALGAAALGAIAGVAHLITQKDTNTPNILGGFTGGDKGPSR